MKGTLAARRAVAEHRAKELVAQAALLALGVGFEFLSKNCPEMRDELATWDEGRTIAIGVLPRGPSISLRKQGGRLVFLGWGDAEARLRILFKHIDSAVLVLTGQIGAHTAFAEHRAVVHGSLAEAMEANRAMAIVVKYLFPGLMLARITKRKPELDRGELLLKARLYAALAPLLVQVLARK